MRCLWSGVVASICLAPVSIVFAQNGPQPSVPLAAHQAVYDMTLNTTTASNGGVEAVNGRLVYEETGNRCDGYTMRARQVISLLGESGERILDSTTNTYESGDGKQIRFKMQSRTDGKTIDDTDGEAIIGDDGVLQVRLKYPTVRRLSWKGDILFPNVLTRKIIDAAREGASVVNVRTYDGTDSGESVYDTFLVIGQRIEPGAGQDLEEAARAPELMKLARWPVKISYYKENGGGERTPEYSIFSEIYENGVSRNVKMDFAEFSLNAELKSLKFLPPGQCDK